MNLEMLQEDPFSRFFLLFIQAKEEQQQLEDKLIEVDKDFALKQALLGWIFDNPWIFAFMLQREVKRLDTPINGVAKAVIDVQKTDILNLKIESETLTTRNGTLLAANVTLTAEKGIFAKANDDLTEANKNHAIANANLTIANASLTIANASLTTEIGKLKQVPVTTWEKLRNDFCRQEVSVSKDATGNVIINALFTAGDDVPDFKADFLNHMKSYFTQASVPGENLTGCP